MPTNPVRALVPTALAAVLLSQEFARATLDSDGTLFTVVIYGVGYSDAVARISGWMTRARIGPVLVTDGETSERLLALSPPRRSRRSSPLPT